MTHDYGSPPLRSPRGSTRFFERAAGPTVEQARCREMADALPILIAFVDSDLRIKFANQRCADWAGCSPDDLVGVHLSERLNEERHANVWEHLERALQGEERCFEYTGHCSRGKERTFEVLLAPSRDEAGSVRGFYLTATDVTAIKREERRQRFLAEAGALLSSPLDIHVTLDGLTRLSGGGFYDDSIVFLSEGEGTVRRVDRDGGALTRLTDLPTCVQRVFETGEAWLCAADTEADACLPHREWQGASLPEIGGGGRHFLSPLVAHEKLLGVMVFTWPEGVSLGPADLAVPRQLAAKAALAIESVQLLREAQEAVKSRDWVLQRVAHDLGNPVAAVVMTVERLLSTGPDPDRRTRARAYLEGLNRQAREMERLIQDLLDMSLLQSGRIRVNPSPTDAARLAREMRTLLEPLATVRGLTIDVEIPERPIHVMADRTRIREALSNLLGNAIKFTPEGGAITLGMDVGGGGVTFRVTDTGPGIPPEKLPTLFDLALDRNPQEQREARVGLGLVIAKEIAEAHGGSIGVASTFGEGSTFSLILPSRD